MTKWQTSTPGDLICRLRNSSIRVLFAYSLPVTQILPNMCLSPFSRARESWTAWHCGVPYATLIYVTYIKWHICDIYKSVPHIYQHIYQNICAKYKFHIRHICNIRKNWHISYMWYICIINVTYMIHIFHIYFTQTKQRVKHICKIYCHICNL
jgi:hypothetical protein